MTVLEIVKKSLVENGYDGLFNDEADCACTPDDLAPCGDLYPDCQAGYRVPCECGEEHDFHIQAKRSAKP